MSTTRNAHGGGSESSDITNGPRCETWGIRKQDWGAEGTLRVLKQERLRRWGP